MYYLNYVRYNIYGYTFMHMQSRNMSSRSAASF